MVFTPPLPFSPQQLLSLTTHKWRRKTARTTRILHSCKPTPAVTFIVQAGRSEACQLESFLLPLSPTRWINILQGIIHSEAKLQSVMCFKVSIWFIFESLLRKLLVNKSNETQQQPVELKFLVTTFFLWSLPSQGVETDSGKAEWGLLHARKKCWYKMILYFYFKVKFRVKYFTFILCFCTPSQWSDLSADIFRWWA